MNIVDRIPARTVFALLLFLYAITFQMVLWLIFILPRNHHVAFREFFVIAFLGAVLVSLIYWTAATLRDWARERLSRRLRRSRES